MEKVIVDSDMAPEERAKRFPIKLPPWHEKRLIWWAAMKGTTKTSLGQNVLQARVEAKEEQIELMLSDRAADKGVSIDELKRQLLDNAGLTPPNGDEDET